MIWNDICYICLRFGLDRERESVEFLVEEVLCEWI